MISIISIGYGRKNTNVSIVDAYRNPNRTLTRYYNKISEYSLSRIHMLMRGAFPAGSDQLNSTFVMERDDKTLNRKGFYQDYSLITDEIPF